MQCFTMINQSYSLVYITFMLNNLFDTKGTQKLLFVYVYMEHTDNQVPCAQRYKKLLQIILFVHLEYSLKP